MLEYIQRRYKVIFFLLNVLYIFPKMVFYHIIHMPVVGCLLIDAILRLVNIIYTLMIIISQDKRRALTKALCITLKR
ncbi:hypothetical protein HanLR1_Chr09g0334211 [Helianthus annuus]|nr:hypothetical protein HanLR1_Chr09g0334211 [Helianthus annuus]